MSLKKYLYLAIALTPISQAAPLCPQPSIDQALNLEIPCFLGPDGQQYRAHLSFQNPQPYQYFWRLDQLLQLDHQCQFHIAACSLSLDRNLNLGLFGVDVFGEPYTIYFNHSTDNPTHWLFSSLTIQAPLVPTAINVKESLDTVTFDNGQNLSLDVGIGSGAFHHPYAPFDVIYTITDRGPNIPCDESADIIGIADFCVNNGQVDEDGKIFPLPEFTPTIYSLRLKAESSGYEVLQALELQDANGDPITGISNFNAEVAYDTAGNPLPFDPEGLDTEALVRLNDGTFWLGEEYAPSLVHVAADGKIIKRVVPQGVQLQGADYPVTGDLPAILQNRKLNRGIESVAVSPDQRYLYTIMQSPLANPDAAAYKASRHVRLLKMRLENGDIAEVVGEYVYVLDRPETFVADDPKNTSQNSVKVSEMLALNTDVLLILERISKDTKLYRIEGLEHATNILGTKWDQMSTSPSLEQLSDLADIRPVHKLLAFDSNKDLPGIASKIEGVALLNKDFVALVNDNDFGIEGAGTQIHIAPIYQQLHNGGAENSIRLHELARYESGIFAESAAEIVAYDENMQRIFVVNAQAATVDVLDAAQLSKGSLPKLDTIDVSNLGAGVNSVAVKKGFVAVAVENVDKQANGVVAVYAANTLELLHSWEAGALPDMVTFSPDGRFIVVANEGEPSDDYSHDPEGSITIVNTETNEVKQVGFSHFNDNADNLRDSGVRIFGPGATVAQDLEPEYIVVERNSQYAYVTLQENNALAIVDLEKAKVTNVLPLGYKDHKQAGNELDVSNKDDRIRITNWPVFGMYQPDAITAYEYENETYLITANEGDARDYDGFSEEVRVKDLTLDANAFPNAADLQAEENLGRLKTTTAQGDTDGDGDHDKIYAYGSRSFSIWNSRGELVFDSGNDFEIITANALGDNFNSDGDENGGDARSDDKGPEPEAITVGQIKGQTYAFIGLERVGGIMVYNVTNPHAVRFVSYLNNRDFSQEPGQGQFVGDISPEGMKFVAAEHSPTAHPLLIVGNEMSGTTVVYEIRAVQ
jgi:hypothetical protein